jgi:hypothetical protein
MSLVTDGFSAMISFLDMGAREKGAEDTCKESRLTTTGSAV